MHIDPREDSLSGTVDIDVTLTRPRALIWLHGKTMHVTLATDSEWSEPDSPPRGSMKRSGSLLTLGAPLLRALRASTSRSTHRTSTGRRALQGERRRHPLRVHQFEAITARRAFPCFDEPGYKIPFTTTLVVPADSEAIANTHETARTRDGTSQRIGFAPTAPLPSYLIAFAVGPSTSWRRRTCRPTTSAPRRLPLRGVTAKGAAKDIAYTLAHTGEILATLEQYLGIEYPYDKLDILAIPARAARWRTRRRDVRGGAAADGPGDRVDLAAEILRVRDGARARAPVTGDLVTMQWWDDTWLNEAFATWIGNKASEAWDPKTYADLSFPAERPGGDGGPTRS